MFGFAKALIAAKQANNGLRDQRAAFDCKCMNVRDIVMRANKCSAFRGSQQYRSLGGDPGNVVAIGQSVGGSSIALHLLSCSGTRGVPFQKAM